MLEYKKQTNHSIKVVAPVPYFPPVKKFKRWYRFSQVVNWEIQSGIEVYHPRFLLTPKIGMILYGVCMFLGVLPLLLRIRKKVRLNKLCPDNI